MNAVTLYFKEFRDYIWNKNEIIQALETSTFICVKVFDFWSLKLKLNFQD